MGLLLDCQTERVAERGRRTSTSLPLREDRHGPKLGLLGRSMAGLFQKGALPAGAGAIFPQPSGMPSPPVTHTVAPSSIPPAHVARKRTVSSFTTSCRSRSGPPTTSPTSPCVVRPTTH